MSKAISTVDSEQNCLLTCVLYAHRRIASIPNVFECPAMEQVESPGIAASAAHWYTARPSQMTVRQVTVRVPATTANLGPAFDCMGMALRIHNEIQVRLEGGSEPTVHISGQGEDFLPRDESNLVYRAYSRLLDETGTSLPPPIIECRNEIPLERGLGSSAAAIVGGLTAANHLAGNPLDQREILSLAVELEGHPDNVAAALLGGIHIVSSDAESIITAPVPLPPDLRVALFIPETSISTVEARAVMPSNVPMQDALFNVGRTALLVNSFATGRLEFLKEATEDRLHQPYRSHLLPAMRLIIGEAMKGGALGAFVSGSGSTVLALCRGREMSVAYEMAEMARKTNVAGRAIITFPSEDGVEVVEG